MQYVHIRDKWKKNCLLSFSVPFDYIFKVWRSIISYFYICFLKSCTRDVRGLSKKSVDNRVFVNFNGRGYIYTLYTKMFVLKTCTWSSLWQSTLYTPLVRRILWFHCLGNRWLHIFRRLYMKIKGITFINDLQFVCILNIYTYCNYTILKNKLILWENQFILKLNKIEKYCVQRRILWLFIFINNIIK